MSTKLVSLVQADPVLMIYALEHLEVNQPSKSVNTFYNGLLVRTKQQIMSQALPLLIGKDPTRRLTPDQIARLEEIWGRRAEEIAELTRTAETLREMARILRGADIDAIRSRLQDDNLVG
jgi:hypothetical protein